MQLRSILRPWAAALAASAALLAACGYEQVNVTVEKVRVHRSSTADDGDAGWSEVVLNPALRVNLLDLTNGVLAELGQAELPAGSYSQLRLQLAANGNRAPYANSIVLEGQQDEIPLDTPSAQQSGLKMNLGLTVAPNELADVVLDFDACKSVVKRGNSGRYNLKPVVTVLPRVRLDGLVAEGYVAQPIALGSTSVSLQQRGVPVRSTVPASDGRFVLYPVPAGSYDLVVSAEGRVTAVMTGVPISATSRTFVTPAGTAINPPSGTPRLATGAVSIGGSTTVPLATIRAAQSVAAATVERAAVLSDADTGLYGLSLVTGAPVITAYDPAATALNFAEDLANAGKFKLTASTEGKTPLTADVNVTDADVDAPFVFAP